MRTIFFLPRITRYCKRVTITLNRKGLTNTIDNSSKHKLINSIARDWGKINNQTTIFNKNGYILKNFSCSGHGGYILLSNNRINGLDSFLELDIDKYKSYGCEDYMEGVKFYIYTFEEDCDWALLHKIFDKTAFALVENDWRKDLIKTPEKSLTQYAESTLTQYYPNFVFNNPINIGV